MNRAAHVQHAIGFVQSKEFYLEVKLQLKERKLNVQILILSLSLVHCCPSATKYIISSYLVVETTWSWQKTKNRTLHDAPQSR